jgi:FKBP-type peptidyl-prolyl cis-trans isomerase
MSVPRILAAVVCAGLLGAAEPVLVKPSATAAAEAERQFAYAVGFNLATQLREAGLDPAAALNGVNDAVGGKAAALDVEAMLARGQEIVPAAQARRSSAVNGPLLAAAAARPGAKTTASGLVYEVIKEGSGARPTAESTVSVHYVGTLASNGQKFDSSRDRGQPAEFPLNGVIRGWTEGLQLMTPGSTYRFTIPSDLAYGAEPPPGAPIPPNAVLHFEVELLSVK